MFVSIGADGKVVVNDIVNVGWGVTYASDNVLVNPKDWENAKFEVVAAKFYDTKHP
jgi:hypothetical protein